MRKSIFGVLSAVLVACFAPAAAHALPDAVSYEYFEFNFLMNVVTSVLVGTLNYTGGPGCGGICNATTALGSNSSVSLNANEVVYGGTSGGGAQAQLTYYVQYNNAPGNYAVNLNANDALSVDSGSRAQAYLAFGPAVPPSNPPGTPQFQSYLVNETDCVNTCATHVGNYQSPTPFPSVTALQMAANTPYLVQIWVQINPAPNGVPLTASADVSFSTSATGGTFIFSPAPVDTDGDGIVDSSDNCPFTPNGPSLGTCMGPPGSFGITCHVNADCGAGGTCDVSQTDRGGVGTSTPDGIGDACQCGDVNNDGIVNNTDATLIKRSFVNLPPYPGGVATLPGYNKCQVVNGAPGQTCNNTQATIIQRAVVDLAPGIKQGCHAATIFP